jgi:uncharacterized linocin/CFP29 family protein
MNNLHRELAPVSSAAWEQIEEEVKRTFGRHSAARRVVDVTGPEDSALAAVATGHLEQLDEHAGVRRALRRSRPVIELRTPFVLSRAAIDDVERGSNDSDWQPAKDAAQRMAAAEDGLVFTGDAGALITGIIDGSSNDRRALPANPRLLPDAISHALSTLRLAGVDGPYALLLGTGPYTQVHELADHGLPIDAHLRRIVDSLVWAPALDGALLVSTRGGDHELRLAEDLAIGYTDHDATTVELYLRESLTFLDLTAEASVAFSPAG